MEHVQQFRHSYHTLVFLVCWVPLQGHNFSDPQSIIGMVASNKRVKTKSNDPSACYRLAIAISMGILAMAHY